MMRWRWGLFITLLLVLPLVWLLAQSFGRDPRAVPSVMVGRPAPSFALKTLEGGPLALTELSGRPVLLNFWSTWCIPCKAEHAPLQAAAQAYEGKVHFVGVVYEDTAEAAKKYLAEHGNRFVQVMDEGSKTAIDYGVAGVPESFFIDKQGVIVKKHVGALTPDVLRQMLDQLTRSGS